MTAPPRHRPALVFALLLLALFLVVVLSPTVGATNISLARAFDASIPPDQNTDRAILFSARLPRIAFGVLVGASLAAAGAVFQALLRNDLATPYTLGVSGGASLGALIAIQATQRAAAYSAWLIPVSAYAGAGLAVAAILVMAGRSRSADRSATLLLGGVTLNLLFSSGILIVQYRANPFEAFAMLRWLMGGLDVESLRVPATLVVPVAGLLLLLAAMGRQLDLLSLGDATAHRLGIDVQRTRALCLGVTSLLTALVVSRAGPIGFVGLIVPHALRPWVGSSSRTLLLASAIAGAAFLVCCDTIARVIDRPAEVPVGIITSIIGCPVFLVILARRR